LVLECNDHFLAHEEAQTDTPNYLGQHILLTIKIYGVEQKTVSEWLV